MKKIVSLLLCLVMMAMSLASCSGDAGTTTGEVDRPNRTLKIAVVVSDKTTEEGIAAMEKAFNSLSSVALTTKAEFVCFTADEYEDQIEAEMERIEAGGELADIEDENNKANGTQPQEKVDEDGYPIAESKQFDIVLITNEEMYVRFVDKGWIIDLQPHLDGIYQKLKTKVVDKAMEYTLIDGSCYAIPAAQAYGSYTYLSVNKKIANYYNMYAEDFVDVNSAYQLFKSMENSGDTIEGWKNELGYSSFSPVLNVKDDFVYSSVDYISIDGGFSLIGVTHTPGLDRGNWFLQNASSSLNLLEDAAYKTFLTMKFEFGQKSYFSATGAEEDYIVGLVEGDYSLRNSNPDYYYIPVTRPSVTKEEVFSSMLAVSAFSVDTKRSVEMIQELMTDDTKNGLLNIIFYGAENANYYLKDGVVNLRESHNYAAHPDYLFGNLNETAYPCEDYGQHATTYSDGLLQNRDLPTAANPLLFPREELEEQFYDFERPAGWEDWNGGEFPPGWKGETAPETVLRSIQWAQVSEYSQRVMDTLLSCDDMESFLATYASLVAEMNDKTSEDPDVQAFIAVKGDRLNSNQVGTLTFAVSEFCKLK